VELPNKIIFIVLENIFSLFGIIGGFWGFIKSFGLNSLSLYNMSFSKVIKLSKFSFVFSEISN
jgi:hypothetical protein